jgi:hypothetical protein
VGYLVDRVAPSVEVRPTEATLQWPYGFAYATFSEKMDTSTSGLDWSIADNDAPRSAITKEWVAGLTAEVLELPPGTGVRVSVPATAKDTFGNPVMPVAPVNFTTKVIEPPEGIAILSNVTEFEIASDKLGLGVLTYVQGGVSKAAWFRPDGTLAPPFMSVPQKAYLPLTYATNTDGTLGTLYRVSTVQVNESDTFYQMSFSGSPWKTPAAITTNITGQGFPILGVPPIPGELGTDKIAIINQATVTYQRFIDGVLGTFGTSGGSSASLAVARPQRVVQSDRRWISMFANLNGSYFDDFSCAGIVCGTRQRSFSFSNYSFSSAAISPKGTCAYAVVGNYVINLSEGFSTSSVDIGAPRLLAAYSGSDGTGDNIIWTTLFNGITNLGMGNAATAPCSLPGFLTDGFSTLTLNSVRGRVAQLGTRRALLYLNGTNLTIRYW